MTEVQFNDDGDSSVLYTKIAKSDTPPGIVKWFSDTFGISHHIVAFVLILLSLIIIIVSFMVPSIVDRNNELIDPAAETTQ